MISQPPGFAFSRNGPVQRTSITNILVFKPSRTADSLSEFLGLESDENGGTSVERPFVSGHNRLYHYRLDFVYMYVIYTKNFQSCNFFLFVLRILYFSSTTCLPIPPHAILASEDIEDQTDPVIIRSYIYEHHFAKFRKDILTVSSYFLSSRAG